MHTAGDIHALTSHLHKQKYIIYTEDDREGDYASTWIVVTHETHPAGLSLAIKSVGIEASSAASLMAVSRIP